jgi:23S rRNA pseudouridine2605 synthase
MTATRRQPGQVPLNRALSKLGIASRAEAARLIEDGRVSVDGRVVVHPAAPVVPERITVSVDGQAKRAAAWRLLLLNKPRGVVTTRRDPEGRRTVFDLIDGGGEQLVSVGRLDLASSGLLLLTTDTRLADWLTDPTNRVPRVYDVTVRGEVTDESARRIAHGMEMDGERLAADEVSVRKRSARESHLLVRLSEGRNREVRRLFEAVGHEVTRLRRVSFGGLSVGSLQPGEWRDVDRAELARSVPGAPLPRR